MTETIPQPRATEDGGPGRARVGGRSQRRAARPRAAALRGQRRPPRPDPADQPRPAHRHGRRPGEEDRPARASPDPFGAMVVMGTAAGLAADLSPGDLVVATEVTDGETTVALPGADLLAAELRRAGLTARAGRDRHSARRSSGPRNATRLAADGYLAADMESAALRRRRRRAAGGRHPGGVRRRVRPGHGQRRAWRRCGRCAQAAPVAEKWAAACRERTVLLAGPRSFCAGRGAGHRDRRAGARAARRAGLRAQADRAQHPRGLRPRAARRGVRRRARRGAGRRHGRVLRARRVARGARRRLRARRCR